MPRMILAATVGAIIVTLRLGADEITWRGTITISQAPSGLPCEAITFPDGSTVTLYYDSSGRLISGSLPQPIQRLLPGMPIEGRFVLDGSPTSPQTPDETPSVSGYLPRRDLIIDGTPLEYPDNPRYRERSTATVKRIFLSVVGGPFEAGGLSGIDLGANLLPPATNLARDDTRFGFSLVEAQMVRTEWHPTMDGGVREKWEPMDCPIQGDLTSLFWYQTGDANRDGSFDTADLISVFQAGKYEDGIDSNSTWQTGDWNADLEFDSADLVAAFARGAYERSPATAVPEPSSLVLTLFGIATLLRTQSSRRCSRVP